MGVASGSRLGRKREAYEVYVERFQPTPRIA
jgi:hypothetical protein